MWLPKHRCGLFLTHNEHKDYYETVKYRLECMPDLGSFISEEDKQKCIDTDELWQLQWYPDTPIGSYSVCGSTLEIVIEMAKEVDKET